MGNRRMPEAMSILPWLGTLLRVCSEKTGDFWTVLIQPPPQILGTETALTQQLSSSVFWARGLVSWCAWPHLHPVPRLSFFFHGVWFLCTSLSWIVQTNAMPSFQFPSCGMSASMCCCLSLSEQNLLLPFPYFYDCPMTTFTQLFPDASSMFCPLWASEQAHSLPGLERGVKGTFPSQHFCTKCSLCQICTGGCSVPPDTLALASAEAGYVTL